MEVFNRGIFPNSIKNKGFVVLVFTVGLSLTMLQVFPHYIAGFKHPEPYHPIRKAPPLHVCRDPTFTSTTNRERQLQVLYQCQGPEYDDFARRMLSFADNTDLHGGTWGRRQYPLADSSSILMMGNSHTRQVGVELACQYSHVLRSMWYNEKIDLHVFEFENNSTLYLLTNTPIVYSLEWKTLLEVALAKSLNDFDALVIGVFNEFPGQVTTHFDRGMIERSKEWSNVDYLTIPPPTHWKVLNHYNGPVAVLSMFTKWDDKWMDMEKVAEYHRKTRVVEAINGRKYVPLLGECGSDNRTGTGICYNDNNTRTKEMLAGKMRFPSGMHRCVGAHGGHPDMVAWDVGEFLHKAVTNRLVAEPQ